MPPFSLMHSLPKTMPNLSHHPSVPVIYVETIEQMVSSVRELSTCSTLSFDTEGISLSRTGTMTLAHAFDGRKVFIFDLLALGNVLFASTTPSLKQILESATITKLMYDCRADSDALFHQYGVNMDGVIDLQVVEAIFKLKVLDERPEFWLGLANAVGKYNVERPSWYGELHSYAHALYAPSRGGNPEIWRERPLPDYLLSYCVEDIQCMFKLHKYFSQVVSYETALGATRKRISDFSAVAPLLNKIGVWYDFRKVNIDVTLYSKFEDCLRQYKARGIRFVK